MSTRHRPLRRPSGWRVAAVRLVSLVVVVAIGLGVYVGVKREERQSCLNSAFQASLDERSRSTDALLEALAVLNGSLTRASDERAETQARREFDAAVARVRTDREAAKTDTRERQGANCG